MAVSWVTVAQMGPFSYSGDGYQTHYWPFPIDGAPNVSASASLNVVSVGDHVSSGQAGIAEALFKRYEYLDSSGNKQTQEITSAVSWIQVERCVSITFALNLTNATAEALFCVYYE